MTEVTQVEMTKNEGEVVDVKTEAQLFDVLAQYGAARVVVAFQTMMNSELLSYNLEQLGFARMSFLDLFPFAMEDEVDDITATDKSGERIDLNETISAAIERTCQKITADAHLYAFGAGSTLVFDIPTRKTSLHSFATLVKKSEHEISQEWDVPSSGGDDEAKGA